MNTELTKPFELTKPTDKQNLRWLQTHCFYEMYYSLVRLCGDLLTDGVHSHCPNHIDGVLKALRLLHDLKESSLFHSRDVDEQHRDDLNKMAQKIQISFLDIHTYEGKERTAFHNKVFNFLRFLRDRD